MLPIRHGLGRLLAVLCCAAAAGCATPPSPPPAAAAAAVSTAIPVPEPAPTPATAHPGRAADIRLAAVGDIMLGGTAAPEMRQYGYDYPFEQTRDILRQAQIVFGNLEGPLTDGGVPFQGKQYVFRSPPDKVAPALARAGFNIVSLANNHTLDHGPEGLEDTHAALDRAKIRHAGAGRNAAAAREPVYMVVEGATVAFLAYSLTLPEEFWAGPDKPGTAFGHASQVQEDIAAARQKADIVIVSFHWGQEGKTELRDYQTQLGRAAIEAGAAVVLGHHPHILQGVERYRDGVIIYSLGNFAFGSYSNTATRSAIALLTFRDNRWHELKMIPLNVRNAEVVFQPRPLTGREADEVVGNLQQLSQPLGTTLENRDGVAVLVVE